MNRKIGLLLSAAPFGGGTFQYNLAVLDAVSSFPENELETVIYYTNHHWEMQLKGCAVRGVYVPMKRRTHYHALRKVWRIAHLPTSRWRALSCYLSNLARSMVRERCDLWIFPSQESWAFETPVRALATIYDLMHRYERRFDEVAGNRSFRYREWLYSNICKWASGILVDSEIGKQQAIDSYDCNPHKIHVLPYVAPSYVHSSERQVNFRKRHGLPARYVFYPGQLWKHKNHVNLIRAINLLRQKGLRVNAVFSGAPQNGAADINGEIGKLNLRDSIFYVGYVTVDELVDLYRNAVALVMPTFFGPTNIPVLEAFALGCPAAVSRIYGMPEQVGDAALTFDPNDVGEIANAIELLWTDESLRKSLIRSGYSRAKEWDQEKFNSRLLEIVRGMLD